uniref:Major facilitator superfamily (MFS) profile domain-containing protein n=2 Tax=Graphocephala atropunctata TaxID=36148 RepID=A0A1B6LDV4_9HEMI
MGSHTLSQYVAGLAAGLTVLAVGCTTGWTTVALKKLRAPDSVIPITSSEGSWIASFHEAGHILSPIPTGFLVGKVGPKTCLITSTIIQIVGWILIVVTRSVYILYLVRFLFGISMGIVFTVTPLYIAEISNPEIRGAMSTGFETMLYLGHLIEFSIGPYVSYEVLALISITIPIVFLIISCWMVESPYFLLKKSRYLEARKTYSGLTGIKDERVLVDHLAKIEEHINEKKSGSLKDLFGSRTYRRSLMIVLVLAIVQRFSGMSAVVAYASFIFPSTIGGLSSSSYTILFGVITLLFTFVSAALMDRSGRKVLTITSCFGSFVVELLTSVYFYLSQNSIVDTTHITWIPFATISMYAGFYSIGMGPIVTTIQGELFPPNVKGLAASIVTVVHAGSGSLVTKFYQIVSDKFGVYVSFSVFSLSCLFGSVFAFFVMPETKNKTLLEIQSG